MEDRRALFQSVLALLAAGFAAWWLPQVLELFAQVREEFQLAMVFITHDLRVAGQMCDHIAVMQRGVVVEYGETAKVLGDPQHEYTRKLIEAVPRLASPDEAPALAA